VAVICDGVFGYFPIGGSDREGSDKAMGLYTMLSDKHPMDKCGGCTAINNSSGLQ
jgi:hypothetical protein